MFTDPLDKSNLLRRISEDEAIDGQGIHYRLIQEDRSGGRGFLALLGSGLLLLLFL